MNCSVLTSDEYGHLSVARGASGGVCFLLAIATAVASFLAYRTRPTPKTFLDHLFLYLTVVAILHTGLFVVETAEEGVGNTSLFCKTLGFFLEWIGWIQLSTTCLFFLCLIYLLVKVVNDPSPSAERMQMSMTVSQGAVGRESRRLKKRHYTAMLLGWTPFPLIFAWIPLYTSERYEAIHWCWIASISEDCSGNRAAFIQEIILWYMPVMIAGGCSLFLGILMTVTYGWWACWQSRLQEHIPGNLLLTGFIFLFSALCGVDLAARTHTAIYSTHNYGVWMAYAILIPWRDLALPLGYSVYLRAWCSMRSNVSIPSTSSQSEADELEKSAFVNIETVTFKDRWGLLINARAQRSNTVT